MPHYSFNYNTVGIKVANMVVYLNQTADFFLSVFIVIKSYRLQSAANYASLRAQYKNILFTIVENPQHFLLLTPLQNC